MKSTDSARPLPVIRASIVEDHARVREALAVLLRDTPGFHCVSVHPNAKEACASLPGEQADVVLLDINLPGRSGIDCLRELKQKRPSLRCLMWTIDDSAETIFEALRAGADGYILKSAPPAEILERIAEVMEEGAPMSRAIARKVIQHFHKLPPSTPELEQLTGRERQI